MDLWKPFHAVALHGHITDRQTKVPTNENDLQLLYRINKNEAPRLHPDPTATISHRFFNYMILVVLVICIDV